MSESISTTTAQPAPPTVTETTSTLSIQDLVTIVQLIQLSTTRGAWRAEELTTVGGIYDKMLSFLEAAGAIKRGPATDDAAAAAAPTETAPTAEQENTNA